MNHQSVLTRLLVTFEQVHIGSLKLEGEAGKFGADRHCMVFPSVRFPSIPPSERFFFVFEDEKAKKPMMVMHLIPGNYSHAICL